MFLRKLIGPRIDLREVTSKKEITKKESRINEIYKKPGKVLQFPKGFLWGAGNSAHQVEGENHNNWSQWEKENAKKLAERAKEIYANKVPEYNHWLPVWKEIKDQIQDPNNYISGRACDHYHRFQEDLDTAKSLGHNAHRFSIEWSRIEPEEGKFNQKEIEHYRDVIRALHEREIEPFISLWHYTLPLWFYRRGGWLHPKAEESFLKFVKKVVTEYKDMVTYWITINEPETMVRHGYVQAIRPPQQRSLLKAFKVLDNLVKTHNSAYKLIHQIGGNEVKVGFAESLVYFESYNNWPHNLLTKYILDKFRNGKFAPKVINYCDFIGLNYYFHSRIRFNPFISWKGFQYNENKFGVSDMGWELYPEGIYHLLKKLSKYKKSIYLTEVGIADYKDEKREWYIKNYLAWVHKAISEGVNVKGNFYWSLLDNFEWSDGFWPRFGLIEMDYQTMERKIRPSAKVYAEICKANKVRL